MGHEVAWLSGHKPTHPTALVGNNIELEYLSNNNSDLIQIWKVGHGARAKAKENVRRRRPHMEDDFKILKADYLSNHWSDLPQVLNLSLGTEPKLKIAQHEDDLQWKKPQNIKNDNLSNLWSDLTQILNLKLGDQIRIEYCSKWRWPLVEDDLTILNVK